ncbi:MAG: hypothetical protein MUE98_15505 [Rhodobacteraceae bacterium]|jgi:hypothetical protein|nr:hypothetical protein [Paracoccaceae bacterium]
MRDFFISAFETLVGVLVVLLAIGVVIAAIAVALGGGGAGMGPGMGAAGGPLAGLAVLIVGAIYVILVGGALYLGLGIYQNTRRTAELLERMAPR